MELHAWICTPMTQVECTKDEADRWHWLCWLIKLLLPTGREICLGFLKKKCLGIVRLHVFDMAHIATWTQFTAESVVPGLSLYPYHWTSAISQGPQSFQEWIINHPCSNAGLMDMFKSIWDWQSPAFWGCLAVWSPSSSKAYGDQ